MTHVDNVPIGTWLRQAREELGLSREGLAYKAGISYKTIERIEAGESIPRRATLTVIEQALAKEGEATAA